MRRITISLILIIFIVLFLRHRLAEPPKSGTLIIPASPESSYDEMLKEKEGLNRPNFDVRPWTRPWWDQ